MRKRTVPTHRIDTVPAQPEPVIDTSFDEIAPERLLDIFETRYAAVLPRMMQVVMGQMAQDKALRNIETALQRINEDLRPATPENHATIEAAHLQAYRYVVISEALRGVVQDEQLHDTTLRFMEAHARPSTTDTSLRKVLAKINQSINNSLQPNGVQPDPHADEPESPFGVVTKKPARTPVKPRRG